MTWSTPVLRRCDRLSLFLENEGIDVGIVTDPKNVYYFTGHMTRSVSPKPAVLCFLKDGGPILLVGKSERTAAEGTFGGEIVSFPDYDLNLHMLANPRSVEVILRNVLATRRSSPQRVGTDAWSTSATLGHVAPAQTGGVEMVDISRAIMRFRQIKDDDEIALLAQSCVLDDFAYSVARGVAQPGQTEIDVYADTYREVVKKAQQYQYFFGDFVSGERSLEVGGPPTSRIMKAGETLILDLWVTTKGYWADTCRTFVIGGKPTKEQEQTLEVVKRALRAGEERLRPGSRGKDVYSAVKEVMVGAGFGDRFTHHAGHGIGLDAWEPPYLIPGSDDELEAGMVCALEPGLYIPGVGGIRVENNYVVRHTGAMSLSSFSLGL